ncbi:hypothetical protein BBJ28_00018721 [Nothophytophthora sp. Chile5]|nr:hypothetical protein BBJ28_00018721 [Nothophytophthora sp. Chile5]
MSITSPSLEEGLAFDTATDAVHAIQDYALSIGKSVKVDRCSGSDRRLVCTSDESCGFFVQVYRQRLKPESGTACYGKWYISSLELRHSATCDSTLQLSKRQIAKLPALVNAVRENSKISIDALMTLVEERHGISLAKKRRLVYRARDLVKSGVDVGEYASADGNASPPRREFVHRRKVMKKATPNKNPERMVWLDGFVETLLRERTRRHAASFSQATTQARERELWDQIQHTFNLTHSLSVTVIQLRAKFRLLQEQYTRTRGEEEEASRDASKAVAYPSGWATLVQYFGAESGRRSGDDQQAGVATASSSNEEDDEDESNVDSRRSQRRTHSLDTTQESPLIQHASFLIRRNVTIPEPSVAMESPQSAAALATADASVQEQLTTMRSLQQEVLQSVKSFQRTVEQSTQVMKGLRETMEQSNQVNAELLEFLKSRSSASNSGWT